MNPFISITNYQNVIFNNYIVATVVMSSGIGSKLNSVKIFFFIPMFLSYS